MEVVEWLNGNEFFVLGELWIDISVEESLQELMSPGLESNRHSTASGIALSVNNISLRYRPTGWFYRCYC